MRRVAGCPREGPGLRVRAEWRDIMLCYVMYSTTEKNSGQRASREASIAIFSNTVFRNTPGDATDGTAARVWLNSST